MIRVGNSGYDSTEIGSGLLMNDGHLGMLPTFVAFCEIFCEGSLAL